MPHTVSRHNLLIYTILYTLYYIICFYSNLYHSILQLVPLCLIWMLPDTKIEQRKLIDDGEKNEFYGAILTITVLVSLVVVIIVSVILIWYPM